MKKEEKLIRFGEGGFYLYILEENVDTFIAYQSIVSISDIKEYFTRTSDHYIFGIMDSDHISKVKKAATVKKFLYFSVKLNNKDVYHIGFDDKLSFSTNEYVKRIFKFSDVLKKKCTIWRWMFQDGFDENPNIEKYFEKISNEEIKFKNKLNNYRLQLIQRIKYEL